MYCTTLGGIRNTVFKAVFLKGWSEGGGAAWVGVYFHEISDTCVTNSFPQTTQLKYIG